MTTSLYVLEDRVNGRWEQRGQFPTFGDAATRAGDVPGRWEHWRLVPTLDEGPKQHEHGDFRITERQLTDPS